jgi:hypothetical protein
VGNPLGLSAPSGVVAAILRLATRQHGLLTRRQWLAGGLSVGQLERALKGGALRVVHPGVYAIAGTRPTFEQDVLAACLAVGGVASHRCAAYLWKFRKFERPAIEVLVCKGHTPRLRAVTVRRTVRLDEAEVTHVGTIPVTTRSRTLLDLVPLTPNILEGALDGVLHRRPRELQTMVQLLERAGPNHPGRGFLASLVAARSAGRRPTESELEDDLLGVIRKFGLPEPEPQYPYRGRRIDETIARRRGILAA